jgi:hypothetical protein
MSAQPSVASLDKGQAVILERIVNMKDDINTKHEQNRSSIHSINNRLQIIQDRLWTLKIKIAVYSAVAGIFTTIITSIIAAGIKYFFKI